MHEMRHTAVSTPSGANAEEVVQARLEADQPLVRPQVRQGVKSTAWHPTAIRMLIDGETVGDTSRACGYNSYPNFTRAFKRDFGVPPSQFRLGPMVEALIEDLDTSDIGLARRLRIPVADLRLLTQGDGSGEGVDEGLVDALQEYLVPEAVVALARAGRF